MNAGFDEGLSTLAHYLIAADAESLKDPKHTLQQLSDAMSKCNVCHASYQIRTSIVEKTAEKASDERLDEVSQRGSHVMPFNLEQTTRRCQSSSAIVR